MLVAGWAGVVVRRLGPLRKYVYKPSLHGSSFAFGSALVTAAVSDEELKFKLVKGDPRLSMVQRMIWGVIRLITGDTGLRRREGLRARRVRKAGLKLKMRPFHLSPMM